jgi:3-deoxy-manno-octulosonate cytidylyltransferase (CMP-KDO synthetase)
MKPTFGIIIPARFGSTRFPGKPLADINGKTMIQRTVEAAQSANPDMGVAVATDDQRIAEVVEKFATVIMTGSNHISGTDRCADALSQLQWNCDVVVNLQGDEPFIKADQIHDLVACFNNEQTQIATLKKELTEIADIQNPNIVKVVSGINNRALYFSRASIPFLRDTGHVRTFKHIGMYAFRPAVLKEITELEPTPLEKSEMLEQLRWLENGYQIDVVETLWASPAIDTPEDLQKIIGLYD